jgi:hypothetical protein
MARTRTVSAAGHCRREGAGRHDDAGGSGGRRSAQGVLRGRIRGLRAGPLSSRFLRSPHDTHAVLAKHRIAGHDGQPLGLRLGHEETIERVAVMKGEALHRRGMRPFDR